MRAYMGRLHLFASNTPSPANSARCSETVAVLILFRISPGRSSADGLSVWEKARSITKVWPHSGLRQLQ